MICLIFHCFLFKTQNRPKSKWTSKSSNFFLSLWSSCQISAHCHNFCRFNIFLVFLLNQLTVRLNCTLLEGYTAFDCTYMWDVICWQVSVRPSVHPSVRPSVCPSVVRPSVRLSVCLSVLPPFPYQCFYPYWSRDLVSTLGRIFFY